MTLRTLTTEELAAMPRTYTVGELRVGMKATVHVPGGFAVGTIVIIDISTPPHEEIWLAFPDSSDPRPVGPFRPAQMAIDDDFPEGKPETNTNR